MILLRICSCLKLSLSCLLLLFFVVAGNAAINPVDPIVVGNMGVAGYLPENTLEGQSFAHALGVDYIDADVVLTKDHVPILLRNLLLDDVTDVESKFPDRKRLDNHYYAVDFSLDEIKSLRVMERRWDVVTKKQVSSKRFSRQYSIDFTIPTLEESLQLIQGLNRTTKRFVGVYVNIKEPAFHNDQGQDITKIVIDLLNKYGYDRSTSNVVLQTSDYNCVKRAREVYNWKGKVAMEVIPEGQQYIDDAQVHGWLMTKEGILELSRYANIYTMNLNKLIEIKDGKPVLTKIAMNARVHGLQLYVSDVQFDKVIEGFETIDSQLSFIYKDLKVDGILADQPDVPMSFAKKGVKGVLDLLDIKKP